MLNRNATRMTVVLFFAIAMLSTISGIAQTQRKAPRKQNGLPARQTGSRPQDAKVPAEGMAAWPPGIHPLPNENMNKYKTRMEKYFERQTKLRGEEALARDEAGEYNRYRRFLRYWEPRLFSLGGDFKTYFELEKNYLRDGPRAGPEANSKPAKAAGVLSTGSPKVWQEVGPITKPTTNVGAEGTGPAKFITFYNLAPSRMLCGSTAGGLFYSNNGGVTWLKTGTDTLIGRSGVSTAVFHPGDYKTWFAASAANGGEHEPMWMGFDGGVFRTVDEGVTWSRIADETQLGGIWSKIYKLAINPNDPDQLWAATSYGLFTTNDATNTNATPSWTLVPALSGKHVYDFEIRPGDATWLYATVADWASGGSLINWRYMYSNDNGATWQNVPGQSPITAGATRLTIEVTPAKADNLYCVTTTSGAASKLHIYDWGTNVWSLVDGAANVISGHAFGVDPSDPNEIFLSYGIHGRRYNYQSTPPFTGYSGTFHPDIEDLIPHPLNQNEVWMCHHGGASVSMNNGLTWMDRSTGLGFAQINGMAASISDPSYVVLGLYHTGTVVTTSMWSPFWSPGWKEFPSSYCDGMRPMVDPTTTQYVWHSCQWGQWFRSTDHGITFSSNGPFSHSFEVEAVFNRLDTKTQYRLSKDSGGNHTVMRTFDRFNTWTQIADFKVLYPPATHKYELWKVYAPETNGDYLLVHLMEKSISPPGLDWTHRLYRTKIANSPATNVIASWEELRLPANIWMGDVDFDLSNPDIVYLANGSSSRFSPSPTGTGMVFKVDYTNPAAHTSGLCPAGLCWDLTQNLPNATTGQNNLALEHGSNGGFYFATDFGVWYSNNVTRAIGGGGWTKLGVGLPNTGFSGLEINYVNNKIRAASVGRGLWEADLQTGCIEPPHGRALWLPFDESAGPTAMNAAPLTPAGTHAVGPTPMTAGKVDGALCFGGSNNPHVNVPSYGAVNFATGNFSLDLWVRRNPGATGTEVLIDKRADVSPAPDVRGYSLFLINGQVGLQLADGSPANYLSQATVQADGLWHHVAVTVNRSNPAGGLFYLDGRKIGPAFNPTGHTGSLNTSAPFRVGARSALSASGPSSAGLKGCLDEVQAFRRVLNPDEVLGLYRSGHNGKCKQSCSIPSVSSFCGAANAITVSAQVCNYRSLSQIFNYSFQGLPAQSGCSIAGPVSFTPAFGTVTVLPGQCKIVQSVITRPATLTGNSVTGCYQFLVNVPATQESFSCGATVDTWTTCNPNPN